MNKKELEEKLESIPKDKYIYQRHDGIINKYIDDEKYYINCKTGIAYEKYNNIFLGKVSEDLIDLIKIGDIVECFVEEDIEGEDTLKYEVTAIEVKDINGNKTNEIGIWGEEGIELMPFENVRTILTKEQYSQNCYKVKEE